MGWTETHEHSWVIYTGIRMQVEAEVEGRDDLVAEVPFCPWMCHCGQYKWRVSPEVTFHQERTEI